MDSAGSGSAKTILVVGTSDMRCARNLDLLAKAGYRPVVATIENVLDRVAALGPPLVVFDFDADDIETIAICRHIKEAHPDTFLLQTAPAAIDRDGRAIEAEFVIDAYLVDPIGLHELAVLVRSLLRLQRVEADLRDSEERLLLAQKSAGLAVLDWVIPTNTFIHSENFVEVFDLEPLGPGVPLSPTMLLERIHPDDRGALLGEFSDESLSAHDFEKEFRIVCRDGSIRWIASRGRLFSGIGGAPERMLSLNYDVTERKSAERANAELAAIVTSSTDAIIGTDLNGAVTAWNSGAERLFGVGASSMMGRLFDEALLGMPGEERSAIRGRLTDGEPHEFETSLTTAGGKTIDIWVTSAPLRAPDGGIIGASLIVRDVSQHKQREEHVRFLMRELTHRSKNLLAVIQAMARQSVTRDVTPSEFVKRFNARLAGLAGSHDLLSRVDWKGASLLELIRSQLSHYSDLFGSRILLEGPNVAIRPEAAQNIGIALHELSTNAAKYGALSNETGKVTIIWSFEDRPERTMVLTWRESGGPAVPAPSRKGFGHVVMDQIVGRALGGHSGISFEPAGVTWRLEVPAASAVLD